MKQGPRSGGMRLSAAELLLVPWALAYMVLVSLDDAVGVIKALHVRRFRGFRIGQSTVGALLTSRARVLAWSSMHRDFLSETLIRCSTEGGELCCWELSSVRPVPWLDPGPWYITPTNRAAARLVPELVPSGVSVEEFPEGCHWTATAVHCQAQPDRAAEWLAGFLAKLQPGNSGAA